MSCEDVNVLYSAAHMMMPIASMAKGDLLQVQRCNQPYPTYASRVLANLPCLLFLPFSS